MNILVTGGCGYLGSTMVPLLLHEGYKVTVVDNLMFDQMTLNQVCHDSNFDFVNADVRLKDEMAPLYARADIIIPLAAYVGAPLCKKDPLGAHTVNNEAVKMMLGSISNDQLVLMPTTNSAYGSGDKNNFCDETSPLNPISKYAVDKVEGEHELMNPPKLHKLSTCNSIWHVAKNET